MAATVVNRESTIEITITDSLGDVDYFDNLVKENTELRVIDEEIHLLETITDEDGDTEIETFVIPAADITDPAGSTEVKAETIQGYLEDIPPEGSEEAVRVKGDYDAAANNPDLDTAPSGVFKGDMYRVSTAGTFFTINVEVGDVLIAKVNDAAFEADWIVINNPPEPFGYMIDASDVQLNVSSEIYADIALPVINFDKHTNDGGTFLAYVEVSTRDISLRVVNETEATVYGETTAISATGVASVALTGLPTSGQARIKVQAKKDAAGGGNPSVHQQTLYLNE